MEQPTKLIKLSLKRVNELGREALTAHEKYVYEKKADDIERIEISIKCKTALEDQCEWVNAIIENFTTLKT